MGRLKTERVNIFDNNGPKLQFSYTVYVNQEGDFTTTIPFEIASMFKEAGVDMGFNRRCDPGFFRSRSLEGLNKEVSKASADFLSRKMVSEKIILKYQISTNCHYCLNDEGEIVPNGTYVKKGQYKWKDGTRNSTAMGNLSYGFNVYVKPYMRRDYEYKSGATKTEYDIVREDEIEEDLKCLKWLNGIVHIAEMDYGDTTKEIEYTEEIALFFVNLIKSICKINEQIKDVLDPESIKKIAEKGLPLLMSPEGHP